MVGRYRAEPVLRGDQMELGVPVYETWRIVDTERGTAPVTCGGTKARDLIETWAREMNRKEAR